MLDANGPRGTGVQGASRPRGGQGAQAIISLHPCSSFEGELMDKHVGLVS